MKKIKVPFSEIELSPIALGCDCPALRKDKDSIRVLNEMYELGINFFDTARGYEKSEKCIGDWLKERPEIRSDIFISTKGCLPMPFSRLNPKCLVKDIEKSLKALGTTIDLYLLHRDDKRADLKKIFSILNDYREKGWIRNYGVSNWKAERIEEAQRICKENGYAPLVLSSVNYSLIPWEHDPWKGGDGCVSISSSKKELDYYKNNSLPVLSYSPLARGFLSGRVKSDDLSTVNLIDSASKRAYFSAENMKRLRKIEEIAEKKGISVPSLAVAYLIQSDFPVFLAIGTSKPSSMIKNIKALDIVLTPEEREYLNPCQE